MCVRSHIVQVGNFANTIRNKAMNLKVGDVVLLKSGGPLMTIMGEQGNVFACHWFKDGELKEATFVKETVEKYIEPPIEAF